MHPKHLRVTGIISLIAAVCLSPRIPLPLPLPGRRFDLRIEDLILSLLLLFWFFYLLMRPRLHLTPLFRAIAVYTSIVFINTCMAVLSSDLGIISAFFYFLKELEYILIFFLIANWVKSHSELKLVSVFLLLFGLLNASWVGYQLLSGTKGPLFLLNPELPSEVYQNPLLLESYGPTLIGEASSLATGGFFMLISLLAFCFALSAQTLKQKLSYVFMTPSFILSMFVSFSRVSIFGTLFGFLALTIPGSLRKKLQVVLVLGCVILSGVTILNQVDLPAAERLSWGFMADRVSYTYSEIWKPLWDYAFDRILLGFGKGSMELVGGLHFTEAHNHFLRVMLESGIFGLIAFVWLLSKIVALSLKVYKNSQMPVSKAVSGASFAGTVGLGFCGLFQDAFLPVTLNEVWWILIGLTAAAYKIENLNLREGR